MCKTRFVVDKDKAKENYRSQYYCTACCEKYFKDEGKDEEEKFEEG